METLEELKQDIIEIKNEVDTKFIVLGMKLSQAKALVKKTKGLKWQDFCEQELDFTKRYADMLIRVYENFSDRGELLPLGVMKLDILLKIKDKEQRETFIDNHDLTIISSTELKQLVKMGLEMGNDFPKEEKPKSKSKKELEEELAQAKEEIEELKKTATNDSMQVKTEIKIGTYILWKELEQKATACSKSFYLQDTLRLAYFENEELVYLYNYEEQKIVNSFKFMNYYDKDQLEALYWDKEFIQMGVMSFLDGYKEILEALGISTMSLKEQIKKEFETIGYKAMCKKYHPDICEDPNAEEIFKIIQEMK